MDSSDSRPDASNPRREPARAPRVISSEALLQGDTQVLIAHGGERYVLRLTRQGKLILTK